MCAKFGPSAHSLGHYGTRGHTGSMQRSRRIAQLVRRENGMARQQSQMHTLRESGQECQGGGGVSAPPEDVPSRGASKGCSATLSSRKEICRVSRMREAFSSPMFFKSAVISLAICVRIWPTDPSKCQILAHDHFLPHQHRMPDPNVNGQTIAH
jgi:hypothetical protein